VSYALTGDGARVWAGVFYATALVANYPHYMATVYRAYGPHDRQAHRRYTIHATAVLVGLGALAHVETRLVPWLFSLYVMWSPWHYTGQNFGLFSLFLKRAGADLRPGERRLVRAAFVASYVMLLATFHEGASADPLVLSLGLPEGIVRGLGMAGGVVFLAGGLGVLAALGRRTPVAALAAPAVLYATQALWFVAPIALRWIAGVATPQARYSSGVLAVMHAAQYLWITQYFTRREHGASWSPHRYWIAIGLGGLALFLPIPWLASLGAHVDFTTSVLIVTAVVNLHHFMIDGVVWKLRDPRVARTLTAEGTPAVAGSAPVRSPWRVAAVGVAAVLLVGLAGLDQWRYWLALRESDPSALQAAVRLNPYDDAVQGRLLRALVDGGDMEAARRAVEAALQRTPHDVNALVNAGVLARQTGRLDDAARHWRAGVAQAPADLRLRLYLAELLQRQGEAAEAVVHYRAYLDGVVAAGGPASHEPATVAKAVFNFGEALAASGHDAEARAQFALARRLARQASLHDLEQTARQYTDGRR
jgi:tetratricopeptide (TPR) repeat protein